MASEAMDLRVGYVLKKYPRLSETFILNEILGLEAAGADVSIFSLNLPDDGRFQAETAQVRAHATYLPPFGSASTLAAFRTLKDLGAPHGALDRAIAFLDKLPAERRALLLTQGLALADHVRRREIPRLHAHFMTVAAHTSYLAHLFTGVAFSVTAHAKDIFRDAVDVGVFREVASAAVRIVTVSEDNRRFIREKFFGGHDGKIARIYNGLPLDAFRGAPVERERGLILGVGRLVEKKGFDRLIAACRKLKDRGLRFRCLIVGDGEERAALEAARREAGVTDCVELLGARTREEVIGLMRRARVLAAPCVTGGDGNRDALPTVLIEALAAGLPSVATPVGGIPEIIEHDAEGLIAPEGDADALASATERLLTDDALWTRFSTAGPRKASARFDRNATLPQLAAVLRERNP